MDSQTFLACLLAVTLLTMSPGADTVLVLRNSTRGGWRDGIVSSFGICSGLFVHATVSALGLSVLLMQTAWLYNLLKIAGACYLIWLGLSSWLRLIRRRQGFLPSGITTISDTFSLTRSLREGFLSNVLNPKTIIFYMAFLPQFINPARPPLSQSLTIAALHFLVAMLWQSVLALTVDGARRLLQTPTFVKTFDGLTGSVLIFLGLRLALEK